jgi:hypothetical protein
MFYIGFMKKWVISKHCTSFDFIGSNGEVKQHSTCLDQLETQLITVFITLVGLNVVEILLPILTYKAPTVDESEGPKAVIAFEAAQNEPNSIINDMQKKELESMMDE